MNFLKKLKQLLLGDLYVIVLYNRYNQFVGQYVVRARNEEQAISKAIYIIRNNPKACYFDIKKIEE